MHLKITSYSQKDKATTNVTILISLYMKYLVAYTTKQFIFISYLEMHWFPSVAFDAIPDAAYFICALTF